MTHVCCGDSHSKRAWESSLTRAQRLGVVRERAFSVGWRATDPVHGCAAATARESADERWGWMNAWA
jgi:hypothetical protein